MWNIAVVACRFDCVPDIKENEITMSDWISVKDKMPTSSQEVICIGDLDFRDDGILHGAFVAEFVITQCLVKHAPDWDHEKKGCIKRSFIIYHSKQKYGYFVMDIINVTHWIPLPKLPKELHETV